MPSPVRVSNDQAHWVSLWIVALLSLIGQLGLCQFFSMGVLVPMSLDIDPSNLWKYAYHFPPTGSFLVLNWLGVAYLPPSLNPFSLAANLPPWLFFTAYAPVLSTCALFAMAAFLRELELSRPAALFGAVLYAWQGDILPFVFPGHYPYIAEWPFYALAAWGALRAQRTGLWPYAIISGACCGLMVALHSNSDRGAIASLLIAALFAAPALCRPAELIRTFSTKRHLVLVAVFSLFVVIVFGGLLHFTLLALLGGLALVVVLGELMNLRHLVLCTGTALLISLASLLGLFQSNIVGVKLAGEGNREQTYKFVTQFSYAPEDTLTYLVPGIMGWHSNNYEGPYWGRIGQWPGWEQGHHGTRNLNLGISTTGTVAALLAMVGAALLLPWRWLGPDRFTDRQRFYGRVLLGLGFVALILAWGWHTPFYRPLFALPLMDKWRNPLKWLEMTNFALVTLGAYGAQHLLNSLDGEVAETRIARQRLFRFSMGMVILLGLGLVASYPFAVKLAPSLQNAGYDDYAIANIMHNLHLTIVVALVLALALHLLLSALWRPAWLRRWQLINPWLHWTWQRMLEPEHLPLTLALSLTALSVAQLAWVATHFIQPASYQSLVETNALLDDLKSEGDQVRVSVTTDDPFLNVLLQNQFTGDRISCLEISAASRIPDDLSAFLGALAQNRERLWFLAGVKNAAMPSRYVAELRRDPRLAANIDHADGYMLEPMNPPDQPSHALVTLRDFLAKATFVPKVEVLPSDEAVLKRLDDPRWNPRETILLSEPPKENVPAPAGQPGQAQVSLITYTPWEIEITLQSAQAGYILVNDQYDPDWQVEVNGHPTGLLRADYILRAIPVPSGKSTIAMHYVAHYRLGGLNLPAEAVNLFSDTALLAAWIVAGLALWRRRRGREESPAAA